MQHKLTQKERTWEIRQRQQPDIIAENRTRPFMGPQHSEKKPAHGVVLQMDPYQKYVLVQ